MYNACLCLLNKVGYIDLELSRLQGLCKESELLSPHLQGNTCICQGAKMWSEHLACCLTGSGGREDDMSHLVIHIKYHSFPKRWNIEFVDLHAKEHFTSEVQICQACKENALAPDL